jgi:hypothetical protein
LDQVGVTAISTCFGSGTRCYREKPKLDSNPCKLGYYRIEKLGLNVFQHIDTTNEVGRLRIAVFGKCRIESMIGGVPHLYRRRLHCDRAGAHRPFVVGPQDREVGAMSAFLVAIGGKADIGLCTAQVRF